jgi:hypothetical protein
LPAQFSDQWENILVCNSIFTTRHFLYPLAEEKMGSNGRSRVHNTRKQNFGLIRPSIAFLLMQKFRVHCEYTHAVVKNHETPPGRIRLEIFSLSAEAFTWISFSAE